MLKLIFNFSRAIQKSQNILKQMRKNNYYIDDPQISQRKEAQQIVEQLYFNNKNNLQQKLEKEEENKLENVIQKLDEDINFRRFQTAQELLDFYEAKPLKSREQYLQWFNQLSYCLKFQEQIQENKLNYYKKLAGQYKAQYNKEYEMPYIIFLTSAQILENQVFNQVIEDFVSNCEWQNGYMQENNQKNVFKINFIHQIIMLFKDYGRIMNIQYKLFNIFHQLLKIQMIQNLRKIKNHNLWNYLMVNFNKDNLYKRYWNNFQYRKCNKQNFMIQIIKILQILYSFIAEDKQFI